MWISDRANPSLSLANATLNRFGPHTKAAVVLVAANRLLQEATQAICAVSQYLRAAGVPPRLRLAIWAGLVLEVFHAQPALVVAAIQARAIQRSMSSRWASDIAKAGSIVTYARCEVGAGESTATADPWRPDQLDLVDRTLKELGLEESEGETGSERLDGIADAWCRRLLRVGRPGAGVIWIQEDTDGNRTAHTYQRVGAVVAPLIEEVLPQTGTPQASKPMLPPWPSAGEFSSLSTFQARAHVLAAFTAVNYLRFVRGHEKSRMQAHRDSRALIHQAAQGAADRLGPSDPATLLVQGYSEYLQLWDLVHDGDTAEQKLTSLARQALAGQRRTSAALKSANLDPGTASYLLEITSVALAERYQELQAEIPDLPRLLARAWRETLNARAATAALSADAESLNPAQRFHIASYANYLALRGTTADLRKSMNLNLAVLAVRSPAITAESTAPVASHAAVRDVHLNIASTAARLLPLLPARERTERAATQDRAVQHALAVIDDRSTVDLLNRSSRDPLLTRIARRLAPAMDLVLNEQPHTITGDRRARAQRLFDRAAGATAVAEADERPEQPASRATRDSLDDLVAEISRRLAGI
ncbi:hypothetical protein [Kineosporia babensis]|uniref:Uncharacterized protein n=1 Tax=Kineosporia babensis TaxID=499548 RepID=A0A9X1NPP1_9ACTN|nr:hypothetical protein [Kineosporia babensis]MCD5316908.1 hypothetical protein [Kineosporia babensis]